MIIPRCVFFIFINRLGLNHIILEYVANPARGQLNRENEYVANPARGQLNRENDFFPDPVRA